MAKQKFSWRGLIVELLKLAAAFLAGGTANQII